MRATRPAWRLFRRAWPLLLCLVLGWLVRTGTAAEPAADARGVEPEFLLFLSAREDLVQACVYRPSARDVILGAMRALAAELGPKWAAGFPLKLPEETDEAMLTFATALRQVAANSAAQAEGWTLKKLVERSLDGYCRTLDAYSSYTDEKTSARLDEAEQPDYAGVGLTVRGTSRGFFAAPFRGRAADRSGIRKGDEILAVDGVNSRAMTLLDLTNRFAGAPESVVQVQIRHEDKTEEIVSIEREKIVSTPVSLDQVGHGYLLALYRINERAVEDCRQTLASIGPGQSVILDLRGCPGGDLEPSIHIAELFLPKGTLIARLEGAEKREVFTSRNTTPYRPKRVVLLQDEGTGSGAEIIIAALRSYAPLQAESRGEKTYGKGVSVNKIRVPHGGYLKFSTARIYGPRDEFWDKEGLPPSSDKAPDAP